MANIKSAKKRIKVIAKKTAVNNRVRNHLKSALKNFDVALAEGNLDEAKAKLVLVEKKLKKAATKGLIHKNTAARKVSRLAKRINDAAKTAE